MPKLVFFVGLFPFCFSIEPLLLLLCRLGNVDREALDVSLVSDEDVSVDSGCLDSVQLFSYLFVEVRVPNHDVLIISTCQQEITQG